LYRTTRAEATQGNFRKAGLSESEGMMLSGHQTNSVYRRYDIIDEQDLRESMAKVQEHLVRQKMKRWCRSRPRNDNH
jgi:hypothetical protein